ncbi:MAG: RNA polymerase subunit sigma-70 [bacterium]|nr:RNA polymerase subunit sigma-70 [bacterium]
MIQQPDQLLDQTKFDQLVEHHRHELHIHCYRMMGTLDDAEDMVQETFLRAWRGRGTYEGRASLRAWLYKIATNVCLDALKKQPRRFIPKTREKASSATDPIPPSVTDPIWLDPYPDEWLMGHEDTPEDTIISQENITMAFIVALHLLPPRQRAILILSDVFDWQASEVALALDTTPSAVKSALHRARATLTQQGQAQTPFSGDVEQTILDTYIQAWQTGDVTALIGLLTDEATFSMPPIPSWYRGRENIRNLISKTIFTGQANGRWRLLPTRANRQIAFGLYRYSEADGVYMAYGIQLVTFEGHLIGDIITFRHPSLMAHFRLPTTL